MIRKRFGKIILALCLSTVLFIAPAGAAEVRVLALGDSLTAGLGVMPEQAWPPVVQDLLNQAGKSEVRVLNAGISGSTSASAPGRVRWHLKTRPDILVLALGANDGLRGLPVKEMQKNLDTAIGLAKEAGVKVILAGMEVPPNYGEDYAKAFRQVFVALAEARHLPFIPFLLDGVAGNPALNQADGIHPTADGQKIVARTVLPYILEAL